MEKNKEQKNKLQTRPPVVVILGHVDHGKTSILDYIRKSKVAEKRIRWNYSTYRSLSS